MNDQFQRAVFVANSFATSFPDAHQHLWKVFTDEVPAAERTGMYGKEHNSYIQWLKKRNEPIFMQFLATIGVLGEGVK